MQISDSTLDIDKISGVDVQIVFCLFIQVTGTINQLFVDNLSTFSAVMFRRPHSLVFINSEFRNINGTNAIRLDTSHFDEISNIAFTNINSTECINMFYSTISLMQNITFENSQIGITASDSSIGLVSNIKIIQKVDNSISEGLGALKLYYSNATIENSMFVNSYGQKGGAIYLE